MYLNDLQRKEFYSSIGLDARQFDIHVIRKTNQSSKTVFPVILDVDHPDFFSLLDKCAEMNLELSNIEKTQTNPLQKMITKIFYGSQIISNLIKLYFIPAIETKYIWTQKIG
jgi:magnesium-protoporphyrin IX monomethyl ester (oxidative) cyclase